MLPTIRSNSGVTVIKMCTKVRSDADQIMEAVRHAEQVRRLAGDDPAAAVLDTLSVAYARAGRFREARMVSQRAVYAARARHDPALVRELEERAALFRAGQAYVLGGEGRP